jgi:glycosyltransferase involved in cell wall biosynthesis
MSDLHHSPERRPHVLMTTDAVGGVWTYASDLARGLTERGWRVTLAVLGPALDEGRRADLQGVDILEPGGTVEWLAETPDEVRRSGDLIARLARECRADLLHLNSPALAGVTGFGLPVVAMCHSCVKTWWQTVRGTPLPEAFQWRAELVARGYRRVSRLLAPTRAFAEATAAAYGLAHVPEVVANGRPWPEHGPAPGPNRRSIFTAGRLWDEGKNIAVLDRMAAQLDRPVLAAGPVEGPNGARIDLQHLMLLGSLTSREVDAQLSRRPIFVSSALYEPFGLAVLEAAAHGCPLVLSDIPNFRELWADVALFVPADDAGAFAAAVRRVEADPALADELGAKARKRAGQYTLEATVSKTSAIYASCLSAERGSATRLAS